MIYFESPGETSLPTWMSLGSANKSTESKFWVMGNRHLQFFLLKKDIYLFGCMGGVVVLGASQVVLVVKYPPANAGDIRDAGSTPGLGRAPGGGHGSPLLYSCLENPMDRGAWRATVHGVAQSQIQLKRLSTYARGVLVVTLGIFPLQCWGFSLVVPDGLQSTRLHS